MYVNYCVDILLLLCVIVVQLTCYKGNIEGYYLESPIFETSV